MFWIVGHVIVDVFQSFKTVIEYSYLNYTFAQGCW